MEINNFSKTERVTSFFGIIFLFLFGWVKKINFLGILIAIGLLGWVFGLYMDFGQSIKVLGAVALISIGIGLLMVEEAEHILAWLTFWFVLFGFGGYYFQGNIVTKVKTPTEGVYMTDAVVEGHTIQYIGGDKMTKIIKISNDEILVHYKKFKDTDRFKAVLNTQTTRNLFLDMVNFDYPFNVYKWVTLDDTIAEKSLFTIK